MSSFAIRENSFCTHLNYLFNDPLSKNLSLINKVINIAFHVFTLCIPLITYHVALGCYSKVTHYLNAQESKDKELASPKPLNEHLKLDVKKYEQTQIQYTKHLQPIVDSLHQLKPTITLAEGTLQLEVGMRDEGRVEHVSNAPVFLYTDYLGPCVAAIGRCKMPDSSILIGVTHLYPESQNFDANLASQVSAVLEDNIINLSHLNKEKIIQDKQFKQQKLSNLIDKFVSHPNYKDEEIELFFAGGDGGLYDAFWRELTVEYAKSIPKVTVVGTYFNPYRATEEIQKKINNNDLTLCFMAGITNHGTILLHKSHAIDFNFQISNFDSLYIEG